MQKVSEGEFFDKATPWAEDKRTGFAKLHNTLVIDGSRRKSSPLIVQHTRNAGRGDVSAIQRAVHSLISADKQMWFKKDTQTATFNWDNTAITVTCNSEMDDNYISEADRSRAGLPTLQRST